MSTYLTAPVPTKKLPGGIPYIIGNEAAENDVKTRHFPRAPELLSDDTVRDICRYLALDYYLFDFRPPVPCREILMANIADMNQTFPMEIIQ